MENSTLHSDFFQRLFDSRHFVDRRANDLFELRVKKESI